MNLPDVEVRKMSCRAGSCTASTAHAKPDRRFGPGYIPEYFPIVPVIINLPVFTDRITKGSHIKCS